MSRTLGFLYGVAAYAVFLLTFLYAIGFVMNLGVPKSIDGPTGSLFGLMQAQSAWSFQSLLIDVALLLAFAIPHSVMARPGFKRRWTRIVPPAVERSTYVLVASLLLILLFRQWRPIPDPAWSIETPVFRAILQACGWIGWGTVLVSTFLIDHFDLFGLRQVWLNLRGRPITPPSFEAAGLYRYCRHPIMLGFIVAFWATPEMSVGHLVFAVATTGYILVAVQIEERDLLRAHGARYEEYKRRTSMLLPLPRRG